MVAGPARRMVPSAMSAAVAPVVPAAGPRPARVEHGFDRDYWLAHCEGFQVEAEAGRIGFVEEVRASAEAGDEPVLAVRAGRLGRRLLLIPGRDVAFVLPRTERLYLASSPHLLGSESLTHH